MKLTERKLRRIIREEIKKLKEGGEYKVALSPVTKKGRDKYGSHEFKIVKSGFEDSKSAFKWIKKSGAARKMGVDTSDFEVGTWDD